MNEQAQAAAAPAAPQPLTIAEARERYTASKAAAKAEANPVSEAARTLGKQAAAARQARQAEASATTQQAPVEQEQPVEDESQAGDTQDDSDTATGEQPGEAEANVEGEPDENQTITLRDGTKVTLDEVSDGFMLKADHTRKTQVLAEERKSFETARTQRLSDLEQSLGLVKHVLPQPKPLHAYVEELGSEEGIKAFGRQGEYLEKLAGAMRIADQEKAKARFDAETARDGHLSENYNKEWSDPKKRETAYTELSGYALQLGATPDDLRTAPIPAYVIQALDKAKKYDALQAGKGAVTKMIADKPRVTKPGAKVSGQSVAQTTVQNAHAKLKSSGNLADAVALLRTMRAGKPRLI